MPTFKTEVLHLVSNVQLIKQLLPCNEQQIQCYLALGADTHTYTHSYRLSGQKQFQETRYAPGLKLLIQLEQVNATTTYVTESAKTCLIYHI